MTENYKPNTKLEKPEEQLQDSQQEHQSDDTCIFKKNPGDPLPYDDSSNATEGKSEISKVEYTPPKRGKGRPRKNPPREPMLEITDDPNINENNQRLKSIAEEETAIQQGIKKGESRMKELEDEEKQLIKEKNRRTRRNEENNRIKLFSQMLRAMRKNDEMPYLTEDALLNMLTIEQFLEIKKTAESKPANYQELLTAIKKKEGKD